MTILPSANERFDLRWFALFIGFQLLAVVAAIWLPHKLLLAAGIVLLGGVYLVAVLLWPWIIVPAIVATTALDITGQLIKETGLGIPVTGFHLAFGLMMVGLLTNTFLRRREIFPTFELKGPLFALWGIMLLSLTYTPEAAFVDGTIGVFRTLFLIAFLYGTQMMIDSRRAMNLVVISMSAALIGGALLAVVQILTERFYLPASFVIAVGANAPRATGTFHNPNTFGTFLMAGSIFLLGIALFGGLSRTLRGWLLLATAAGFGGLVVTFSRANWVAAAVGIGVVLFLAKKLRYAIYAAVIGLLAVMAVKEFVPFAEHIYQRLMSIFTLFEQFGQTGRASSSARVYFALAGMEMWLDSPLFGTGWRSFPVLFDLYKSPEFPHWVPTKESHTLFANILAELGLVGLTAATWLVVRTLRRGWTSMNATDDPYLRGVMCGLLSLFIAFQVSLSFTADFSNNFLWFFTGMIFAVAQLIDRSTT